MELIIAELSRYVLIILFAFYTLFSFRAFSRKTEEGKMPYGMPRGRSRF